MIVKAKVFGIFKILLLRYNLLRILFLLFVSTFATDAFSQKNPTKLFEQIKSYLPEDISKAEKLTREYYTLGLETNNDEIKAKTDYLYGLIYYFKSRFYISNKYYSKALNSAYAKTDLPLTEKCWNNMGINYEIQNMFPESLDAYQKSLKIAEKLKDSISIGKSWINVGLLNAKTKKHASARQITLKALEYFKKKEDSTNMALCYQNLTFISSDEGNYKAAINYTFKGLAISVALKNQYEIGGSYYNLANNFCMIDDLERSNFYLEKALEVAPQIMEREALLAKIYVQRGTNLRIEGKFAEAEKSLKYALKLVGSSGANENDYSVYQGLADLYAKSGDYKAYTEVMAEFDKLIEQKTLNESNIRVDELQALYEFQKKVDKIGDQQKDIVVQKKQLSILFVLIVIILTVLLVITIMHLRMRRYMRSLFENKVEQTKNELQISEIVAETEPENKQLFALFNQIISLMNDKKTDKEIDIEHLAKRLEVGEEQITEAIHLFGKKDYHTFLSTYYIDDICRRMIKKGKKLSLKKIISESPFANVSTFNKQFKEITGLTPEQFMNYSEHRLQQERKQS